MRNPMRTSQSSPDQSASTRGSEVRLSWELVPAGVTADGSIRLRVFRKARRVEAAR